MMTPMDENVKTITNDLEKQSTNIKIRKMEPSSRFTITVVIVDRKISLAVELKRRFKVRRIRGYWQHDIFSIILDVCLPASANSQVNLYRVSLGGF